MKVIIKNEIEMKKSSYTPQSLVPSNVLSFMSFQEFTDKSYEFFYLWPLDQWVSSLVGLVIMYWMIGNWYNKRLKAEGGWISWQARISMITLDLLINFVLGLYYMDHRGTVMGDLMVSCPIAISPVIFFIEFAVFVYYYRTYKMNKN